MKRIVLAAMLATVLGTGGVHAQEASPAPEAVLSATPAGIPLDSDWRRAVYAHAVAHLQHPSWGVRHGERNYVLGMRLAQAEGLTVDPDVLFAAAFLHDWGGLEPYALDDVDHAVRSDQLAEPFLRDAGFPMEKYPAVRAAILGHMYTEEPEGPEAVVLHDADTLDFLGVLGSARLLAATRDGAHDYDVATTRIRRFAAELPPRLKTEAARGMAPARVTAMLALLDGLQAETPEGARP